MSELTKEQVKALREGGFIDLDEIQESYSPEMWAELSALEQEFSLQHIREQLGVTQEDAASRMDITQSALSKLEKRQDMHLRTLRRYVRALGGRLDLLLTFPGKQPVIFDIDDQAAHHHG